MKLENIVELLKLVVDDKQTNITEMATLDEQIGEHVIIRTYSAGVHFGVMSKKMRNEVILLNSRRLFRFMCPDSISLSDVAINGLEQSRSRICAEVPKIWLEAIEIISVTQKCILSIKSSPVATQD
jgi:hypothetical protein